MVGIIILQVQTFPCPRVAANAKSSQEWPSVFWKQKNSFFYYEKRSSLVLGLAPVHDSRQTWRARWLSRGPRWLESWRRTWPGCCRPTGGSRPSRCGVAEPEGSVGRERLDCSLAGGICHDFGKHLGRKHWTIFLYQNLYISLRGNKIILALIFNVLLSALLLWTKMPNISKLWSRMGGKISTFGILKNSSRI
jgi:hypothetical protein